MDFEEQMISLSPAELRQYAMGQGVTEQTLTGSVLVPILQNVAGGIGAGGLFAIVAGAIAAPIGFPIGQGLAVASALFGLAVTCLFTMTRFFSDEVGIGKRLYAMGAKSRQPEIDALRAESTAALLEIVELKRGGAVAPTSKSVKREAVIRDGVKLLKWAYTGAALDRRSCEGRGMSQTSWAKARRLLVASGLLTEDGTVTETEIGAALSLSLIHISEPTRPY